ncbi:MAG: LexA family protein [Candidatus Pristimantibacillus sp.]
MKMTVRGIAILDAIESFISIKGYPPTVRELGEAVGLKSSGNIHRHLQELKKLGRITWDPTKPRTITLVTVSAQIIDLESTQREVK